MATIVRPNSYSSGQVISSSAVNADFNTIYTDYNGNITNANISASAAIVDTKLATISTAGKVNISALTVASQATGDIIYASSASAWARLAVGTSSQVLIGGTTPSWSTAPAPTGSTVQIVNVLSSTGTTGTTTIPFDNTVPQNTEGDQYMTLSITPTSATNKLIIIVNAVVANSGGRTMAMALFQDSTAGSLFTTAQAVAGAGVPGTIPMLYYMTSGTTSSTAFKIRIGADSASTTTFNGAAGTQLFGGVSGSSMTIIEVKV